MDIEERDVNGVKVVDVFGKLNTGTSPEAEAFLNELIDEGANNIVLNLEELDFIASTGLRIILATGKKVSAVGGKLVMCNPNPTVGDVLQMSGFDKMFNVYATEGEALEAF